MNHTDIYLKSAELPEEKKLLVAMTYLDPERLDWYTVAVPDSEKPSDWAELESLLKCHFEATTRTEEEKMVLFIDDIKAEIAAAVGPKCPKDLHDAIREAARARDG